MRRASAFLLLTTAVVGCQSKPPAPTKVPLGQTAAEAPAAGEGLTGPVLEQLSAPPYLYLRIRTPRGEIWAAVPGAKVENGATVTVLSPMLMSRFESKSLNRTFDEVYFGTLATAGTAGNSPAANPHAGIPQPAASVAVGKVEKASGTDARTVAEVWARKAFLDGKVVTIRGMVVKYNGGVMGKNWIHLQDGSGDAGQGTNDITVTSPNGAAKGEIITITGTVRTDRDFGAGYRYAVIVEDARVLKE